MIKNTWSEYIFFGEQRDMQTCMRLSNMLNVSKTFNRMLGHPVRSKNKATNEAEQHTPPSSSSTPSFPTMSAMSSSLSRFMSMVLTKAKTKCYRLFEFPSFCVDSFFYVAYLFERIRVSLRFY